MAAIDFLLDLAHLAYCFEMAMPQMFAFFMLKPMPDSFHICLPYFIHAVLTTQNKL